MSRPVAFSGAWIRSGRKLMKQPIKFSISRLFRPATTVPISKIGVLDGKFGEFGPELAVANGLVVGSQFAEKNIQGPAIRDRMVHHYREHVIGFVEREKFGTNQRSRGEIKRLADQLICLF